MFLRVYCVNILHRVVFSVVRIACVKKSPMSHLYSCKWSFGRVSSCSVEAKAQLLSTLAPATRKLNLPVFFLHVSKWDPLQCTHGAWKGNTRETFRPPPPPPPQKKTWMIWDFYTSSLALWIQVTCDPWCLAWAQPLCFTFVSYSRLSILLTAYHL